jgi:hypothetical protein
VGFIERRRNYFGDHGNPIDQLVSDRNIGVGPPEVRFVFMNSRALFIVSYLLVWLVLCFSAKPIGADVDERALWSLQLKNVTISEALKQVAHKTGIKIYTPDRLGTQVITRSYKNQTIEYILRDLLRDTNYALVWSFSKKGGIKSVAITTLLDKAGGAGAAYSTRTVRPNISGDPDERIPAPRQPPLQRRVSSTRRPVLDNEPEDDDSEVSAQPQTEDQAEGESEAGDEESAGSSEDSDEEKSVRLKKMPEQSDEDTEKGAEERPASPVGQSEGEESSLSDPGEEERTGQE